MGMLHKCTDIECPFVGQRTDRNCGCHQTDEQVMRTALEQCQKALAMMIAPDAIRQTTTINAFEQCTAAELAARKALGKDRA